MAVAEQGELGRLLPLYGVLEPPGVALAWRTLRGEPVRRLPLPLSIPTATFLGFACVSLVRTAGQQAGDRPFFLPPAVRHPPRHRRGAPFPAWMPKVLAIVAVGLASIFAIIGLIKATTCTSDVRRAERGHLRLLQGVPPGRLPLPGSEHLGRHLVLGLIILVTAILLKKLDVRMGALVVP